MRENTKICIFSGKRGGFGAYVPLMNLIEKDPDLELQIILGDMHAAKEFGSTVEEAQSLFPNSTLEIIEMGAGRVDSPIARTENLGVCLQKSAKLLSELSPDILFVHGDRGEHLVMALAALNLGVVIAHTQGGDVSGNIDDIQRHAITKLAHLHFPESDDSTERIKKMGEEKWRIHTVGSLYIDRIVKKMYPTIEKIAPKYGLKKGEKYSIILTHPDTFESPDKNGEYMHSIIEAVKSSSENRAFIIYPCSDPGYEKVVNAIEEVQDDPQFLIYKNIEHLDFLSLLDNAQFLIGNSSCALVEAPYLRLPAINIGNRQLGRAREKNVVDALADKEDIVKKIHFVLKDSGYIKGLGKCGNRLGEGDVSEQIIKIIKKLEINKKLLRKRITY